MTSRCICTPKYIFFSVELVAVASFLSLLLHFLPLLPSLTDARTFAAVSQMKQSEESTMARTRVPSPGL